LFPLSSRCNIEEPMPTQSSFEQLHEGVQQWVHTQGWQGLRPIQAQAVEPILSGSTDLIISASTAGGKTEAAFLPIFSKLLQDPQTGIRVLGLSPLKALINDQHRRLSELGDRLQITVTPWHGDITSSLKQRLLKQPSGIVLMTPESLEALLARRGPELSSLLTHLSYIVIDEMHAFIGSERGCQLQSLMHRVELATGHFVPRIGLSATLGDMSLASDFLRPGKADKVTIVNPPSGGGDLKLQLRGYNATEADWETLQTGSSASREKLDICLHLFKAMRGSKNMIFVNGRAQVEQYAVILRHLCDRAQVPNEFWPHHGSLSKELREEAEEALRGDRPANLVCTTTLEMGIDVGNVASIAQIGSPYSVASLRQRLGRSGRRAGESAIARFYITVAPAGEDAAPQDSIYPELVQAIAIINLMFDHWCEPPELGKLHLSTLIQQLLSAIAQYGSLRPDQAWVMLCQKGAFQKVDQATFMKLLRCLGQQDLIQQTHNGELVLGLTGEKQVNHYTFYTAFQTPEEYRVRYNGQVLGNLPIQIPLMQEMQIILAGNRWKIVQADDMQKLVEVEPAGAGKVPTFMGGSGVLHNRIRQEMYRVYCATDTPSFLDETARSLLVEARANFQSHRLQETAFGDAGRQTLFFPWQGDTVMNTILVQLVARGLKATKDGVAIAVDKVSPPDLMQHLGEIVDEEVADAVELAATVKNKRLEKYDRYLSDELLCQNYAASCLDVQKAWDCLRSILYWTVKSLR
jgi:ATP-dependent helicase Lhr and Lhr-like helicase